MCHRCLRATKNLHRCRRHSSRRLLQPLPFSVGSISHAKKRASARVSRRKIVKATMDAPVEETQDNMISSAHCTAMVVMIEWVRSSATVLVVPGQSSHTSKDAGGKNAQHLRAPWAKSPPVSCRLAWWISLDSMAALMILTVVLSWASSCCSAPSQQLVRIAAVFSLYT